MAVWFVLEIPGMSAEQGDAVIRHLRPSEQPLQGQILHVEAPTANGMRVVDVWESEEAFRRFFEERLGAAFSAAGVPVPPDLQPQALPANNLLLRGVPAGVPA